MKTLLAAISSSAAALMMAATALCTEPPTPAMGDLALGAVAQTPPSSDWEITYSQVGKYTFEGPGVSIDYPWPESTGSGGYGHPGYQGSSGWLHLLSKGTVRVRIRWTGPPSACPLEAWFQVESSAQVTCGDLTSARASNGFTWDTTGEETVHSEDSGVYLVRVEFQNQQLQEASLEYEILADGRCGPFREMRVQHAVTVTPSRRRLSMEFNATPFKKGPGVAATDAEGNHYVKHSPILDRPEYNSMLALSDTREFGLNILEYVSSDPYRLYFGASGVAEDHFHGDRASIRAWDQEMTRTLPWWYLMSWIWPVWIHFNLEGPKLTTPYDPQLNLGDSREVFPIEMTYRWMDGMRARGVILVKLHPSVDNVELYAETVETSEPDTVNAGYRQPERLDTFHACPFVNPSYGDFAPVFRGGTSELVVVGPAVYDYRGALTSVGGVATAAAALAWSPAGVIGAAAQIAVNMAPPPAQYTPTYSPELQWNKSFSYTRAGVDSLVPSDARETLQLTEDDGGLVWRVWFRSLYRYHYSTADIWGPEGYIRQELNKAYLPNGSEDVRIEFRRERDIR